MTPHSGAIISNFLETFDSGLNYRYLQWKFDTKYFNLIKRSRSSGFPPWSLPNMIISLLLLVYLFFRVADPFEPHAHPLHASRSIDGQLAQLCCECHGSLGALWWHCGQCAYDVCILCQKLLISFEGFFFAGSGQYYKILHVLGLAFNLINYTCLILIFIYQHPSPASPICFSPISPALYYLDHHFRHMSRDEACE